VLVLIFAVWNPTSIALQASSIAWSHAVRPAASLAFLGARLAITGIGIAAAIALWVRRPGAVWLAKLTLVLFVVEGVVRLSTRMDLTSAPPGTRLPLAMFLVVHNTTWYLYLQFSRRVRATYGLESQR
jgi:hypothetical protein